MTPRFYQDGSGFPGQAEFKRLVVQGIKMTMGVTAAMGGRYSHHQYNFLSQVARASSSV